MKFVLALCFVIITSSASQAFVSKIDPALGYTGRISCHQLSEMVNAFIAGSFTGATLKSAIATHYGLTFTAEDDTDFTNLGVLINAEATAIGKHLIAHRVEATCMHWEEGWAYILNSGGRTAPNSVRHFIGIAQQ